MCDFSLKLLVWMVIMTWSVSKVWYLVIDKIWEGHHYLSAGFNSLLCHLCCWFSMLPKCLYARVNVLPVCTFYNQVCFCRPKTWCEKRHASVSNLNFCTNTSFINETPVLWMGKIISNLTNLLQKPYLDVNWSFLHIKHFIQAWLSISLAPVHLCNAFIHPPKSGSAKKNNKLLLANEQVWWVEDTMCEIEVKGCQIRIASDNLDGNVLKCWFCNPLMCVLIIYRAGGSFYSKF